MLFLSDFSKYAIKHKKKDFCYAHTIAYAYIRNARKRAHVRIRKQKKDHFRRNDLFLKRDLQAIYRIANAISMIGEPMGTFGGRIPISSPEGVVPPNVFVSERRTGRFLSPAVEAFAGVTKAEVDWKVKEGSDWYVAGLADVLYTG